MDLQHIQNRVRNSLFREFCIEQFRDGRELGLDRMLLQPFRGDAGRYPLGQRQGEQ